MSELDRAGASLNAISLSLIVFLVHLSRIFYVIGDLALSSFFRTSNGKPNFLCLYRFEFW